MINIALMQKKYTINKSWCISKYLLLMLYYNYLPTRID
jgi:hypothetical protein